jgi:erythromycin esterase
MNIIKYIFLYGYLLLAAFTHAQPVKEYVLANTRPIYSNDIRDERTDDLEVIGNAIGDAQVVLLGEQDHGDAPTFKAKARLIKYLHERKGFTVIAFESDLYALTSGQDAMRAKGGSLMKLMNDNIFSLWTKCPECEDVFRYIDSSDKSSSPLKVTGFDNQLYGRYRTGNYVADMKRLLTEANSQWTDKLLPLFNYAERYYPLHAGKGIPTDSLQYLDKVMDSAMVDLNKLPDSSYLKVLAGSLKSYTSQMLYLFQKSNFNTVRDKQMAANFLWLYRHKFPGEKIIIWAHNYHIARDAYNAFPAKYGRHHSMGSELAKVLKDSMYVLGFTSFSGKAGQVECACI